MESITEQIRSKPTQTNDDIAENAHDKNAAGRVTRKPVGEQKAKLPGDHDKRADFFCVPRPVPPPFGLSPNHTKDYSDGGQARGSPAKNKRDAREGTHPERREI